MLHGGAPLNGSLSLELAFHGPTRRMFSDPTPPEVWTLGHSRVSIHGAPSEVGLAAHGWNHNQLSAWRAKSRTDGTKT